MESLYLEQKTNDSAWEGTIVETGGRISIAIPGKFIAEIDSLLPMGETGKLIWIKDEPKKLTREI